MEIFIYFFLLLFKNNDDFPFKPLKLQDGEALTDGMKSKVSFEKEGQTRKLIIRGISVHDDGEYTCSLGDEECTAEINVIGIN